MSPAAANFSPAASPATTINDFFISLVSFQVCNSPEKKYQPVFGGASDLCSHVIERRLSVDGLSPGGRSKRPREMGRGVSAQGVVDNSLHHLSHGERGLGGFGAAIVFAAKATDARLRFVLQQ